MIALQQLTLHLSIVCDEVFIDPLDLIEQLTGDMSQLHSLDFYACAENTIARPSRCSFSPEAKQHDKGKRCGQVCDAVGRSVSSTFRHAFTLPFQFTRLTHIGRQFPENRFQHVVDLWIDDVEFDHELLLRVARCFPALQGLLVREHLSVVRCTLADPQTIRHQQIAQFPHLKTLHVLMAGVQCIEQFLNENITHLPQLAKLTVMDHHLRIVTHDFTRQDTRRNCARVTELESCGSTAASKDYHDYFPSL